MLNYKDLISSSLAKLEEKHLTPAELKKREEIAKAMERKNPGMNMGKKMAIATAVAKRVAEETEQLDKTVAEGEVSQLHKAWDKALKTKPVSPQQQQRNKERWAKRQAEREQGVAEGWTSPNSPGKHIPDYEPQKGWMLRADPELEKKFKEKKELAKKRQAAYGNPAAGKSVKEEYELDEAKYSSDKFKEVHKAMVYNRGADHLKDAYENHTDGKQLISDIKRHAKTRHKIELEHDDARTIAKDLIYPERLKEDVKLDEADYDWSKIDPFSRFKKPGEKKTGAIDWTDSTQKSKEGGTIYKAREKERNPEGGEVEKKKVGRPAGAYKGEYKKRDPAGKAASAAKAMASKAEGLKVRREFKDMMNAAIKKRQAELAGKSK